jgi:hypothetical protein
MAWFFWSGTDLAIGEFTPTRESSAIASLLWDLWVAEADEERTEVIGADGQHHQITYTDTIRISIRDLWTRLTTHPNLDDPIRTVRDLRLSFGELAPTIDLDGNATSDVAPVDVAF